MPYINNELIRLLGTHEPISLCDRSRKTVGIAGPTEAIAPTQARHPAQPRLGWMVLDYQLDPSGEAEDAFSPVELVWILIQRFRNTILRATLDHHRYRLMFPGGASIAWPGRALSDWRPPSPTQRAQWMAAPTVVPLSPPRISPPRPPRAGRPESERPTLSFSWG